MCVCVCECVFVSKIIITPLPVSFALYILIGYLQCSLLPYKVYFVDTPVIGVRVVYVCVCVCVNGGNATITVANTRVFYSNANDVRINYADAAAVEIVFFSTNYNFERLRTSTNLCLYIYTRT